jgi:hypothetical protein
VKKRSEIGEKRDARREASMDPWSIFLYGMKAPMTREKYRGRLAKFFDFIGLTDGTMEERAKAVAERDKKEPEGAFATILQFAQGSERNGRKLRDKPCDP